jgi:exopolysaccharide biosynthesis polyprenyl glycosylphosphotransferase
MTNSSRMQIRPTATRSKTRYNNWVLASFVLDTTVIAISLVLAYFVRFRTGVAEIGVPLDLVLSVKSYVGHILFGTVLMMLILTNFRFYSKENMLSFIGTLQVIIKSTVVWLIGYLTLSLVLKFDPPISRIFCALGLLMILVLLPLWRAALWRYLSSEKQAVFLRQRAVVVGWSENFGQAFEAFNRAPEREFEIIGLVTPPDGEFEFAPPKHIPVLGSYERFEALLQMGICQMVIVADDTLRSGKLLKLASLCEKEMVEFKLVPTCFRVLISGLHLESVGGVPVLGISKLPLHSAFNQYLKRFTDIVGALVGLTLAAPIIGLFGVMIYRESPGPIFYRQRRLGANGNIFHMIKLRSMKLDAESAGKAGWTVKNDPRCLKIGALMRRLNIDEIPQFWNVLKGDMSLVGPRPERPELIEKFKEEIPHYNARHNIKPGITGWAQVNGLRGDTDLSERVRFDLHYIENWNVIFDIQIMALTFFKREGAC